MKATEMIQTIYHALDDKKAINPVIMDVRNVTMICDYFIIASGENYNQVQAMANNVEEEMDKKECHFRHMEGYQAANWILMDYNDVVVHLFYKEDRTFYDLERIWRDARTITLDDVKESERRINELEKELAK